MELLLWHEHIEACKNADILKYIFLKENFGILIQTSQNFVSKCPLDNKSSLVWLMTW